MLEPVGLRTDASAAAAPGDGGAKIDTYNVDGASAKPCAREEGPESIVTYTCRDGWALGPFLFYISDLDAWEYVGPGDISGGNSYVDKVGSGIYEGCRYYGSYDICDTRIVNPRTLQLKQGGYAYYTMAAWKWGKDTHTAWSCLEAMYHPSEWDIVHNCT